jgi:hypothetical protein
MANKKPKTKIRPNKLALWLKHYLNEACSTTFLNKTESARKARYNANENSLRQIGCQNYTKLKDEITKWLDEFGLSENALKESVIRGFKIKESKIINVKGTVEESELPEGTRLLLSGSLIKYDKHGNEYTELTSVIAIDVDSIEIQRKFIEMGIKIRGLYAPERHEVTVKPLITYKNTAQDQLESDSGIPQITDE